jgi:ribose transport system substrate-binding protein
MKSFLNQHLVGCLIALLALAGLSCNTNGERSGGGKPLRLAFVTNNTSDFWTIARRGTDKADTELENVEVEFKLNSETTAAGQQRIVDDLLAKGIDGIAISPVDPKNQVQMINAAASKALIITQDSDAADSNRTCYIGTNNVEAGRQAGELVKEALPQGGSIMVFVGTLDALNAQERYSGLKQALEGSNINILDVRTDNTDFSRAKANAADTLVSHPDIAGLVGLWAYNGPQILYAVQDAGKVGKVKIIAFDEDDATLAGIKEGSIYATVVQQPYKFGYESIRMMAKVIGGDRSGIPETKQIYVPTRIIKKDGVDEFISEINKLRGRS